MARRSVVARSRSIAAARLGSSTITISSGTLVLDNSQHFSGTVAGLATASQVVDFADINVATLQALGYTGNTQSGTLTVTDGTHTAHLALLGNYTVADFHAGNDGSGGTLVIDPPVSSPLGQGSLLHGP